MKPHAEIKIATKQLVDSLLSMNTSNRDLRKRTVEQYCTDIRAGNWKLTNQGIGVTVENVLADGQHRLEALKSCGYPPLQILVVYGLEPNVQIAVDAHAKRSARDMLHFAFGYRVSRSAPAIGNVLLKAKNNQWFGGFTNHVLMECLRDYAEEIETITSIPSTASYFAAPFLAGFVSVLRHYPDDVITISKFMKRCESGEMLDKTMPEFHLRNFVTNSTRIKGGGEMQKERFEKAIKSLECHLRGDSMGVLRA